MSRYLAGRGIEVAVHYASSSGPAKELVAEIEAAGGRAEMIQADLLDETQSQTLVGRAVDALGGPLTLLINNASIFEYDNILTATRESWDRHMESNLRAPYVLTQAFARQALPAAIDASGESVAQSLVVNMVDQRVLKPTPEFSTYSIAKHALWALTRMSAQGLAPAIRVNAIGPGPTMQGARQTEKHFADQRAATPLQRGANPDDIAAALGYLIDAKSVTGQLICVDGGQHLAWQTPDILGTE
jgi:NAD(P)-dependent dehydrogenase (short-subunit alcohol dehydrogenase family)